MTDKYSFGRTIDADFPQAIERVTQALGKEGFGVLSDIDVAGTLKKKVGLDMPAYRILGACNPQFAHRALEAEPEIGTLLPCNVVLRAEGAKTRVDIMDPLAVMKLTGKPEIAAIAKEVRGRLDRVLAAL
jgi:uncharacterized protein (DUF302 family)